MNPSRCVRKPKSSASVIPLLAAFAVAGCAITRPMMPVPALYTGPHPRPLFADANPDARDPPLDLLFITDRAPSQRANEREPYTADRSRSMAFGSTTILFGEDLTWETLVKQSLATRRTTSLELKLGTTRELGRFPRTPYEIEETAGGLTRTPTVIDAHEAASQALQAEVARRLAPSARKEMVLYVHGYRNTFADAAMTMGELCHFLGREFVCAVYSWPAGGRRGILFGYNVDYESSVFASEHLRKTIRTIAQTPGLTRLHLLAHSRGTDALITALSDLNMEAYTQRSSLSRRYKIGNIVLVAPDIDTDVAFAKIFNSLSDPDAPYGNAPAPRTVIEQTPDFRMTVYVSPNDKALAASSWVFGSLARFGRFDPAVLTPAEIEQARRLGAVDMIQVRGTTDFFGHGYFTSNPKVSADLVALLRYGLRPNEPGRPLDEIERPFWRVPTGLPTAGGE